MDKIEYEHNKQVKELFATALEKNNADAKLKEMQRGLSFEEKAANEALSKALDELASSSSTVKKIISAVERILWLDDVAINGLKHANAQEHDNNQFYRKNVINWLMQKSPELGDKSYLEHMLSKTKTVELGPGNFVQSYETILIDSKGAKEVYNLITSIELDKLNKLAGY
ncbi:MAG: hypothetical protein M1124_00495 [Candidatus Marsarchaeota archaeon]|jgi:hypothetical protein|nr:hypothetical protein [Candidatus Marsarchaeota archaeon]